MHAPDTTVSVGAIGLLTPGCQQGGRMLHAMNPSKLFPLIITDKLDETRAYYLETLGCQATHDLPEYLQVRFGAAPEAPELAFCTPGSMGAMQHGQFSGEGLIVSVPTRDADARHGELSKKKKAAVISEPSDKPWGWRSFATQDPNGIWLDFFHELEQTRSADAAG